MGEVRKKKRSDFLCLNTKQRNTCGFPIPWIGRTKATALPTRKNCIGQRREYAGLVQVFRNLCGTVAVYLLTKDIRSATTIIRILKDETYTGTLVQGRQTTYNHKVKDLVEKPSSEWIRTENAHEPIIRRQDYDLVQKILVPLISDSRIWGRPLQSRHFSVSLKGRSGFLQKCHGSRRHLEWFSKKYSSRRHCFHGRYLSRL